MGFEGSRTDMLITNMFMLLLMLFSSWVCFVEATVSYDHKAIIIDGQRRILISGSIHYPRSTPQVLKLPMWLLSVSFQFLWTSDTWEFFLLVFFQTEFFFFFLNLLQSQMWPDLIQKAKDGGLDVIQTYVFWNGHEPSPGKVLHLNLICYCDFSSSSPFDSGFNN